MGYVPGKNGFRSKMPGQLLAIVALENPKWAEVHRADKVLMSRIWQEKTGTLPRPFDSVANGESTRSARSSHQRMEAWELRYVVIAKSPFSWSLPPRRASRLPGLDLGVGLV